MAPSVLHSTYSICNNLKVLTSHKNRCRLIKLNCLLELHNHLLNISPCSAVSPYLKSLSMVAANKLLHLLEAFSTSWFLFSVAQNHHLVFFLLEAFNNIIQYQFDGKRKLPCNRIPRLVRFKKNQTIVIKINVLQATHLLI